MRIKSNIATSEEGFIFNPGTGDSFSTNSTGSEIIMLLKKGKSLEDIFEHISGKYDVDDLILERDLEDFSSLLKDYGILE